MQLTHTLNLNRTHCLCRNQLISTALAAGVPFVGFGFMDNAIMIIAGETIEVKLGLVLGITTMASAAIGNLLSDVAGVGMGSVRCHGLRIGRCCRDWHEPGKMWLIFYLEHNGPKLFWHQKDSPFAHTESPYLPIPEIDLPLPPHS